MADVRRILLVRLDGLGDALACVPALEGLRRAVPGAQFGALCSDANAALFSAARVERTHLFEDGADEGRMVAELRSACYTDALVATEEPVGYRIARAAGIRRRVGFWHRFEKTFKSMWQFAQLTDRVYRPAAWVAQPEHEVGALYRLAERLGAALPIPDDAASLRAWLHVAPQRTTVVGDDAFALQIASKLTSGGWSAAALASAVNAALNASPFRSCVLLAGGADEGLARAVLEQMPRVLVESGEAALAPPSALPEWLGAIASAGALVSPDTGAAHAAGMLGVPVVDIFEPARFAQLTRQWRPWAAPSRCLAKPAYTSGAEAAFGAQIGAALRELAASSVAS